MGIIKKFGLTARSPEEMALVVASSIRLSVAEGSDSIVRVTFRLQAAHTSDRRPLVIDFSRCPLLPLEITGTVVDPLKVEASAARRVVVLKLREDAECYWDKAELTVTMRWSEVAPHPPLLDKRFLYAAEELPTIGKVANSASTEPSPIPIVVEPESDRLLVGAISATLRGGFHREGPHVQAIFATAFYLSRSESAGEPEISVLTETSSAAAPATVQPVCAQIREISAYFGERLSAKPGLRIAVALDSKEGSLATSGALLTAPRSWYRSQNRTHGGRDFQIARIVANIWWGKGCTVGGERGVYLASGVAFALGLAWTKKFGATDYFDRQLSYFREHLTTVAWSSRSTPAPGERTVPIGIAIFDGLDAHSAVWDSLAELTCDYWGQVIPDHVLLDRLQSAGVPVSEFDRKQFRL